MSAAAQLVRAMYAVKLTPRAAQQYVGLVLHEIDLAIHQSQKTLTAAVAQVIRRNLQLQLASVVDSPRGGSSTNSSPSSKSSPVFKKPRKGASKDKLCFVWARSKFDASCGKCSTPCPHGYRHHWAGNEKETNRRRYAKKGKGKK